MPQNNNQDVIPKKNRPHDKSHGFHANQEGLQDIQHEDVSTPPVTGEGYNTQHGNDGLDVDRKDEGTGSSERYPQSGSRKDSQQPPDATRPRGDATSSRH